MKRTYHIETTIELDIAVEFDYWPPRPSTPTHPPEDAEVSVKKVYLVYHNGEKPDLTDSIETATGWDSTLINQINQLCLDHAAFDKELP